MSNALHLLSFEQLDTQVCPCLPAHWRIAGHRHGARSRMIILVAFAHSLSRDYARFHLAHHDPQIEVVTADSLASAIQRANAMPALDVVVLDMMMPDMDGLLGLRAGLSNKEIADKLQLSEVTVKHHVKSLRGKLGARNRVHAICRAIELQIE